MRKFRKEKSWERIRIALCKIKCWTFDHTLILHLMLLFFVKRTEKIIHNKQFLKINHCFHSFCVHLLVFSAFFWHFSVTFHAKNWLLKYFGLIRLKKEFSNIWLLVIKHPFSVKSRYHLKVNYLQKWLNFKQKVFVNLKKTKLMALLEYNQLCGSFRCTISLHNIGTAALIKHDSLPFVFSITLSYKLINF